ncbi:AraC family transcriptional regulator [Adhaeribacter rhizoryzae]|uniref:Helix-turn-helix domain-containing protein n=1 Tax=Adhaeribacter rhizoryzae TaxID=2607907 RepID=A0A5M6DM26_9BACT|nr:AraC family transcriptional regulator [Adhaeribacter rhizoryzae]KAA5547466.1 helix-turn-helix domain-containing protein [Adhaeribacter rhizoryzae]
MKPHLLKVEVVPEQSFAVRQQVNPLFYNQWHYHEELELTYVQEGSGIRFVGDSIQNFQAGDLILLGSNLPHFWRGENQTAANESTECQAMVVQFTANFWGDTFLDLPELSIIKELFRKARRGIHIKGETRQRVAEQMQAMVGAKGLDRLTALLHILQLIALSSETTFLSSDGFNIPLNDQDTRRIAKIHAFTLANFSQKIKLEEVAATVHLSPNAFCRYFKTHTRKTYSQFLLEIRIGHACKLLMEDRLSIGQICLESGFANFSNFNRYFKAITNLTPQAYARMYR